MMYPDIRKVTIIVALSLLLSGCATTDDPREGGFFGGIGGLASGKYEQRISERGDTLESLKAARANLEEEQSELERQEAQSLAKVQAERRRLAALEADTKALSSKVSRLKTEDHQKQAEIAALQERITRLQKAIAQANETTGADALEGGGTGSSQSDIRRRELEVQRRQLEEELHLLTDMYLQLGS